MYIKVKKRKTGWRWSQEAKDRFSKSVSGENSPSFGRKLTEEHKKNIGLGNLGKQPMLGKKHTQESKDKISAGQTGEKHWRWIEDRSLLKDDSKERGGQLHREWSKQVKNRDGWKCRISNDNCSGSVVAHHILSWRDHVDLHYEVNNGITLCHAHHPRKRAEEKRLIPEFQALVSVSKSPHWQ